MSITCVYANVGCRVYKQHQNVSSVFCLFLDLKVQF